MEKGSKKPIKGKERDASSTVGSNRPQGGIRKEKRVNSSGDRLKAKEEQYRYGIAGQDHSYISRVIQPISAQLQY